MGSVLLCRGEWKVDKCYGNQFVAATWEETMPATVYGIEEIPRQRIGQGHRPPVRPGYHPAIRNGDHRHHRDGDRTALRSSEHRTRKRVAKIRESWEKQKDIKNVMLFLQGYGVSTAYAAKIYREYGKGEY